MDQILHHLNHAGHAISLSAVAVIIELSPAVQDLDKRLSKLDDKDVGRVPELRERVRALEAWRPRVVRD